MKKILKNVYKYFYILIPSFFNALISGLTFNPTHRIVGKPYIIKKNWLLCKFTKQKNGNIVIGNNFTCNNKVTSNSIGLIHPCIFNINVPNSRISIGNNVGISGSTINATTSITIGDIVLIGSGCIITDTDSHPINYQDRNEGRNELTNKAPIVIKDNCFIGARCIILKGVTIGEGSVLGAGCVVSHDIPPYSVVCGNPAKIVKKLK